MPIDPMTAVAYKAIVAEYPDQPPFHPGQSYPEYIGRVGEMPNVVYEAVRACWHLAGLDVENYGTAIWNPLKSMIQPGETVLIKPNLVKETHPRDPDGWRYVMTHGSVIRAVVDYVWKALAGRGRVIVADAPHTDSSFRQIVTLLGLDVLQDHYRAQGLDLELIDLRQEEWTTRGNVIVSRRSLVGDPTGSVAFDLKGDSEFNGHQGSGHYFGADYDTEEVNHHHSGGRHEYLIAGSAIHSDVIFSLPKLKTHNKAGITVSLKNLVGINADKNWLPHYTAGDPELGGDEHPRPDKKFRLERALVTVLQKLALSSPFLGARIYRFARPFGERVFGETDTVIRSGAWWGNDTVWRMCLDLNKILVYGRSDGSFRPDAPASRKRHYVLVDGIVAGEGRGPMNPDPLPAGMLIFGTSPATVDAVSACLMGYEPDDIPIVRQAFRCRHYALTEGDWRDLRVISNHSEWNGWLKEIPSPGTFHFAPHYGWKGHIERKP